MMMMMNANDDDDDEFFYVWLTDERRLTLFPHHRESTSPARSEQDLKLRRT